MILSKVSFYFLLISVQITIVFIILKKIRFPSWEWKGVLSPLWLSMALSYGGYLDYQSHYAVFGTIEAALPGFCIVSFIFAALRLLGKLKWKWAWIFSPLWLWGVVLIGKYLSRYSIYLQNKGLL